MERYRTVIVGLAAVVGVVLVSAFVFASATSPVYACSNEWQPTPTASPAPDSPPNPGYVQPDLGTRHAEPGERITYAYCPPASGGHYNASGLGPIQPRFYGPNDQAIPAGWIHNLEHGAMVILYRGREGDPGLTEDGQSALRALYDAFPNSPVCGIQPGTSQGPVIARFDDMATPYAALLWGRVLPLDELDAEQVFEYWRIWGERSNPEKLCQAPSPSIPPVEPSSPAPSDSGSPSAGQSAPAASPSAS